MRSCFITGIIDFFFQKQIYIYDSPNIASLHMHRNETAITVCLHYIICLFTFRLSNRRAAI